MIAEAAPFVEQTAKHFAENLDEENPVLGEAEVVHSLLQLLLLLPFQVRQCQKLHSIRQKRRALDNRGHRPSPCQPSLNLHRSATKDEGAQRRLSPCPCCHFNFRFWNGCKRICSAVSAAAAAASVLLFVVAVPSMDMQTMEHLSVYTVKQFNGTLLPTQLVCPCGLNVSSCAAYAAGAGDSSLCVAAEGMEQASGREFLQKPPSAFQAVKTIPFRICCICSDWSGLAEGCGAVPMKIHDIPLWC